MDDYRAQKERALDELYAQCERIKAERDHALRDAELARERADRTHEQLRGAVDALREAREYVAEAVARREDMGLSTSAAHELLARISGGR